MPSADGTVIHDLLTPQNCAVVLIDFQPQMLFAVKSIDGQTLVNNAVGLAKAAVIFKVPTILTTVAEKSFSGPTFAQLREVLGGSHPIDRTTMNAWEDPRVVEAIKKTGRKKLILAGLWTESCIVMPTIHALQAGYEIYVVADACGGTSPMAHDSAIQRMVQAGAVPVTWLQVMLEWQRDWARQDTYAPVMRVANEHAGAYGIGIQYAKAVLGEHAGEAGDHQSTTQPRAAKPAGRR